MNGLVAFFLFLLIFFLSWATHHWALVCWTPDYDLKTGGWIASLIATFVSLFVCVIMGKAFGGGDDEKGSKACFILWIVWTIALFFIVKGS